MEFLDYTGLQYYHSKIKQFIKEQQENLNFATIPHVDALFITDTEIYTYGTVTFKNTTDVEKNIQL